MARFKGFGPKALALLQGPEFHQSKAWFDENRAPLREATCSRPMVALLDDLTAAFAKQKIPLKADGKQSIFRINRDIRFSKDKSPYKTHMGAVMTRSGGKIGAAASSTSTFRRRDVSRPPASTCRSRRTWRSSERRCTAKPARFTAMVAALKKGGSNLPTTTTS